ncbi:MAG TPA: ABC transporter ATP-binding protein [Paludibaculum sp.]|jgi:ABC-2 type transport system ATP-binding protein
MKVIEAKDVVKRYGGVFRRKHDTATRPALNGVSFSIERGETVGLLGPNGAGKTTLLKILSTLIELDTGSVKVLGHDLSRDPEAVRRQLGLVTCDERSFYWRLTGRQNLRFFAELYRVPAEAAKRRIDELFETLGLTEAADHTYHTYSTGMRQKMAIGRGLLASPDLVLFDEPTRSLDPLSAHNIRDWIIGERRRNPVTTRLVATNQLHEAERLCDRVLIVNRGEIIADGTIAEIRRRFEACQHTVHRILCRGDVGGLVATDRALGIVSLETEAGDEEDTMWISLRAVRNSEALTFVLQRVLANGARVEQCQTQQAPLDEIFISLVIEDRNSRDLVPA